MDERVPKRYKKDADKLGQIIRDKRKQKNLNVKQLADKVGYSESYVWKVESGHRIASTKFLLEVAKAFDIKLETLLRG